METGLIVSVVTFFILLMILFLVGFVSTVLLIINMVMFKRYMEATYPDRWLELLEHKILYYMPHSKIWWRFIKSDKLEDDPRIRKLKSAAIRFRYVALRSFIILAVIILLTWSVATIYSIFNDNVIIIKTDLFFIH